MKNIMKTIGFTLIELSIVLVIIGLLIGGVLVGRDLIRGAEIRGTISEIEKFKTAANTFLLTYNCIPGDCMNATDYITGAVNGNGNGLLSVWGAGDYNEVWQFWYQLGQAKLLNGQYSGVAGPLQARHAVVGTNVPSSKLGEKIGYTIVNWGGYSSVDDWGGLDNGPNCVGCKFKSNVLLLGSTLDAYGYLWETMGLAFSPQTAYNIDSKIDDGMPGQGSVVFFYPNFPNFGDCVTDENAPTTSTYILTSNDNKCTLMFGKLGF